MGKRARAARPEAAAQPLKCHRSEHAHTARRAPHFLALPDPVINILFDMLSPNPATTGTGSRDALNLAATCRSLNEYYRHAFIVALDLSSRCHYSSDVVLRAFERLSRVLAVDNLQGSWLLAPVCSHLQVLRLSEVGVSDSNAARFVSQMANLVELDLSYTAASDETARAVSSLGKIEEVHLNGTRIGSDGVTALASGVASQSLRILKLINCPEISMDDVAVDVLSNKISQRGYGVVSIYTEYADDSDDSDDR